MDRSSCNDKILSYCDAVLRRSDLGILSGPYYLNDRIIEFYFSYLSSTYSTEDILLVPPSISFWITNCSDFSSLRDVVEPLGLANKKLVIFTVNDNMDVSQAEGGTHWSLLALDTRSQLFVHHDSFAGLNRSHAIKICKALESFLGIHSLTSPAMKFVEGPTPQQSNGYDCGLYVMAIAKIICEWHLNNASSVVDDEASNWFSTLNEQIDASSIASMREAILRLILGLMHEK